MKNLYLLFLLLIVTSSCDKEGIQMDNSNEKLQNRDKKEKVLICHFDVENNDWDLIEIPLVAWEIHVKHGDVRLDDVDGDGYVPDNDCGYGLMGDCDDSDALINPGMPEICEDGIDNNCNGSADEDEICNECLNDQEPPEPNGIGLNTAIAPGESGVLLLARDFDFGSMDNCTSPENLRFSFSGDEYIPMRIFSEDEFILGLIEVQVWVIDEAGNQDWMELLLQLAM